MSPSAFYSGIEKLGSEVVPAGEAKELLLLHIVCAKQSHPNDPPAKSLLAELTSVADPSLFSAAHAALIREIAHYWV